MAKQEQHYHVMAGQIGCMPDYNEIHIHIDNARRDALSYIDCIIDAGIKVDGTVDTIYTWHDGTSYCMINACVDYGCLKQSWWGNYGSAR